MSGEVDRVAVAVARGVLVELDRRTLNKRRGEAWARVEYGAAMVSCLERWEGLTAGERQAVMEWGRLEVCDVRPIGLRLFRWRLRPAMSRRLVVEQFLAAVHSDALTRPAVDW